MDNVNYFKELFESTEDYRKSVFLLSLIKTEKVFVTECGYLKIDDKTLKKIENILIEQNEEYLEPVKIE